MNLNPQFESIGKQFAQHYYELFSSNRAGLSSLYTEQSMLTYEKSQFQGIQAILEKLQKLPQNVKHNIVSCDCQPTPNHGVCVLVNGDLSIDGDAPIKFVQFFHLIPNGSNGYAADCSPLTDEKLKM